MTAPQPGAPRASMADVARLAGVSTATVSRSLRGALVAEGTRTRVLEAARELRYEPSPAASHLASGRTRTVALVVPFAARWFFSEVIAGVEDVLRRAELNLLLFNIGAAESRDQFFARLPLRQRVDAAVVVSSALTAAETEALTDLHIPMCVLGSTIPGVPSVRISDEQAAATAARHLLALRHERIAMVCGDPDDPIGHATTRRRRSGFEETLARAQLRPAAVVCEPWGIAGGTRAMERLLGEPILPTAVLAESDEMALGVLATLRRAGLRVPEDISVVGVDDHELASAVELTTVSQPVWQQGAAAATAVVGLLGGGAPEATPTVLPTRLIVRATTAPARA
jgi:LacI family transcriptional regulator, repressor for deo operon, udp, cdd, tsx, nupC, and nupG